MINYDRELRIEADIKRKRKVEKAIKFAKKIQKIQKKARCYDLSPKVRTEDYSCIE